MNKVENKQNILIKEVDVRKKVMWGDMVFTP